MRQPSSLLERFKKALTVQHDRIAGSKDEPIPERWVDLIHDLNEKERIQSKAPYTTLEGRERRPYSS